MASSSDGLASMITTPFSSAGDMKYHLQSLLDSKERQLQQAGTLGQRVLAQQMELEERIRQLQEFDADKLEDDKVDEDARNRYRELAETLMAWDQENAELSSGFGSRVRSLAIVHRIPQLIYPQRPSSPSVPLSVPEEPERPNSKTTPATGTTAAAQSRRAKNAAHRADDVGESPCQYVLLLHLLTKLQHRIRLRNRLGAPDRGPPPAEPPRRARQGYPGHERREGRPRKVDRGPARRTTAAGTERRYVLRHSSLFFILKLSL